MKNLLAIILIAAFFAGCAGKSTGTDDAAQATTAVANKTCTLAVDGMTCSGCENTVSEAITKIAGVTSVAASHLDSTAIVSFDSTKTSISAIGAAIAESGYEYKGEKKPAVRVE